MKKLLSLSKRQDGKVMIVLPAAVVGACLMGYGGMQRTEAAPEAPPAIEADWAGLQTDLCAERCMAVEANRMETALRSGAPVSASSGTCECHIEGEARSCQASVSAPREFTPDPAASAPGMEADFTVDCVQDANHATKVEETWVFPMSPDYRTSAEGGPKQRPMPKAQWMAAGKGSRAGLAKM